LAKFTWIAGLWQALNAFGANDSHLCVRKKLQKMANYRLSNCVDRGSLTVLIEEVETHVASNPVDSVVIMYTL